MSNQTLCTTQGLKFRWINGQCFEFVFPNGKVLLSDPYFDDNEHFALTEKGFMMLDWVILHLVAGI